MNRLKPALFAGLALCAVSLPAHATLLNFELTGSKDASFQLDSNPTPDSSSSSIFGDQIQFDNVAGTYAGVAGVASTIGFASGPIFADLNILGTPLSFTQFSGPTLFSGTATAPIFSTGTFALTSIVSGNSTLTITDAAPSGVPEPGAWAMMLLGFGGLGAAMRSRRERATATA